MSDREACADAARDGLALARAALSGDDDAASVVAANLASPRVTALLLAQWLISALRAIAGDDAEIGAMLADWQAGARL